MKLLLIPHFYMINWAKEISDFLYKSGKFISPNTYNKNKYMPFSKTSKLTEEWLNASVDLNYDGYFFVNLQDYIYSTLEFNKPVFGVILGSRLIEFESGNTNLSKDELEFSKNLELKRLNKIAKGFPLSKSLKNFLYDAGVTSSLCEEGMPVFINQNSNVDNREFKILFNHRLVKQKNPAPLFRFPEEWRRKIIISAPVAFSMAFSKELKANENIMTINRDNGKLETGEKYKNFLRTSKYGLSLAKYESFGMSVAEGLMSGVCYICPKHSAVAFEDYMHPSSLFDGELLNDESKLIPKIIEMIETFESNDALRIETIQYAQDKLKQYYPDKWLNNILTEIEKGD